MGEKSQLQGKKMIKDLTKKMFLLESSDGGSSAGLVAKLATKNSTDLVTLPSLLL